MPIRYVEILLEYLGAFTKRRMFALYMPALTVCSSRQVAIIVDPD
jgi:hypothetical protein